MMLSRNVLLKATLVVLLVTDTAVFADKGDPSLKEFFRVVFGFTGTRNPIEPQPIQVIGAGLPRTGTASFVVALSKLGLHTYHMKDGAIETPGHLQLWYSLYLNNGGDTTSSFDDIMDDMAVQGFNATSDGPACFWYKQQMKRYPNAKVVLTVRGDGSGTAWARSFSSAIIDVMSIMQEIPYRWFPLFQQIEVVVQNMVKALGADIDSKTNYPVKSQLPDAYDRWVETVKATVPEDKLIIHAPKDGWKPLCDFLSPLSSEIMLNCDVILASGEIYPHVNDKAKVQALLVALQAMSTLCKLLPFFFVGVIAFKLLMMWRRWRRQQRVQRQYTANNKSSKIE